MIDGRTQKLIASYRAFEMTCVRNLVANEREWRGVSAPPAGAARPLHIGRGIADQVAGDVCYAFYARATQAIKIGRTANLLKRWAALETSSGIPLQLLLVWRIDDSRAFESALFSRYAEHRGIGEWFKADGVLPDLQATYDRARRTRTR